MVTSIENLSPELQSMAANLGKNLHGQMFDSVSEATSQIQSQTIEQEMVQGDQATALRAELGVGQENVPGYLAEPVHAVAAEIGTIGSDAIDSLSDLLPIGGIDTSVAEKGAGMASGFDILEIFDELGGLDSLGDVMMGGMDPTALSQASTIMDGLKDQGIGLIKEGQSSFMAEAKNLAGAQSQSMSLAA